MHPDARLAHFGEQHDGVASRAELTDLGLDPRWIENRVRSRHLTPLFRGVYAVGHGAASDRGLRRAALLAGGEDSHLSHRSCAAHFGAMQSEPRPLHITREKRMRRQDGLHPHRAKLAPQDVGRFAGFRVTSPARLVLDLAETESRQLVDRVYNELQVLRLLVPGDLLDALPRWAGRHGVAVVRDLVEAGADGVTRSELEDLFKSIVRGARLPPPEMNVWIDGVFVDAVWRRQRVVVELDSCKFHGTDLRFESDRAKGNVLALSGWIPLRFTYRRLKREPLVVIAEVVLALTRGERLAA